MTSGETGAVLEQLGNIQCKLGNALGSVVAAEMRMRLIGQLSESVRITLKECVKKEQDKEFWNCKLTCLQKSIESVFNKNLESSEIQKLESFRKLRNKIAHADFVSLMKLLKIEETGREVLPSGKRSDLDISDIKGAIISIDYRGWLENVQTIAEEVIGILNKIIWTLANE